MAIQVWLELVCDRCADSTGGRFSSRGIPRGDMVAEAKKRGWVFDYPNDQIYCQKCAADDNEGRP